MLAVPDACKHLATAELLSSVAVAVLRPGTRRYDHVRIMAPRSPVAATWRMSFDASPHTKTIPASPFPVLTCFIVVYRLPSLSSRQLTHHKKQAGRDPSNLADDEETGAAMNEHPDTWGFSWMPAIEEFVEQEAARATDDERDYDSDDETENGHNERYGSSEDEGRGRDGGGHRELSDGVRQVEGAGMDSARSGRKRTRFRMSGGPSSSCRRQQPPPPPSYNETLLADKSFHNPNASETMADAFGIVHPASFILDVRTDDRTWGGAAVAAAAAQAAAIGGKASGAAGGAGDREGLKKAEEEAEEEAGSGGDRNWFYDTVRDRQNRLWADTRVRKGVELARKGQHQVREFVEVKCGTHTG